MQQAYKRTDRLTAGCIDATDGIDRWRASPPRPRGPCCTFKALLTCTCIPNRPCAALLYMYLSCTSYTTATLRLRTPCSSDRLLPLPSRPKHRVNVHTRHGHLQFHVRKLSCGVRRCELLHNRTGISARRELETHVLQISFDRLRG